METTEQGDAGAVTFGPYLLEGVIGRGATSTVYLAHQIDGGAPVALKVLDPFLASTPGFGEQLESESTVLAGLSSPHVVATRGTGVIDGARYLAMTYVEGASLRTVEQAAGRLTSAQCLGVLAGALEGLAAAHAAGLVHGDLKPENILCDRSGVAWLCDFGQVVTVGDTTEGGTPAYMSPEAAQGLALDTRSDLYSLGVVLYEALAGRRPFNAANDLAVMRQHIEIEPPPLDTAGPATRALVARSLAKSPAHRPQTAEEFLKDLEAAAAADEGTDWRTRAAIAGFLGIAATAVEELATPSVAEAATVAPTHSAAPAAKVGGGLLSSHPFVTAAVAVVAIAGIAVGGAALARSPRPAPSQPASAAKTIQVPSATFVEVEQAMCARLGATDSGGDRCAMYAMKVSRIDPRWILAEGVGYYSGTAVHPNEADARSDLGEGVYDTRTHQVLTLDHASDCASAQAIVAPVPHSVAVEWGLASCSSQSGASTTTSSSSTTIAVTPSTAVPSTASGTPAAGFANLDLSAIAGSWGAHEQSLTVSPDGQGTLTYADLTLCPSCSEASAPRSTMQFQLTGGGGTSATGTVTSASDTQEYQVGEAVTIAITAGSPGQILNLTAGTTGGGMYCNSSSAGQCGP